MLSKDYMLEIKNRIVYVQNILPVIDLRKIGEGLEIMLLSSLSEKAFSVSHEILRCTKDGKITFTEKQSQKPREMDLDTFAYLLAFNQIWANGKIPFESNFLREWIGAYSSHVCPHYLLSQENLDWLYIGIVKE